MIHDYASGDELYRAHFDFLNTNKYLSVFFRMDAPLLKKTDHANYAFACMSGGGTLLALKVEPYSLLFFGDEACVPEAVGHLIEKGYEMPRYLCAYEVGDRVTAELKNTYGRDYYQALGMDFMEAVAVTEPSSEEVVAATPDDLDEICECLERFVSDCGLLDKVSREKTAETISSFRLVKRDGKVVSMAKLCPSTDGDIRISAVYTRNEYRGQGYARKVVNAVKNEILFLGKKATLNVDQKNPISNHIYESIGFVKLFSQGEYREKKQA